MQLSSQNLYQIIPFKGGDKECKIPLAEVRPGHFFIKSQDQFPEQQRRIHKWLIEYGNIDSSEYHELMRQTENYSSRKSQPEISDSKPDSFPDQKLHNALHLFQKHNTDNFHMTKGFRKELQHEIGLPDSSKGDSESPLKPFDQKASKDLEIQDLILKV